MPSSRLTTPRWSNTTTIGYLIATTTSPNGTAVEGIADTGVYLGDTAGSLYATTFYGSLSGNATSATSADSVPWSGITSTPTTLSGYGISDAKISSGTITLGSNSITPLTSHQSVSDKNVTLAWGTQKTIATIGSTDIHVTLPSNPNTDTAVTSSANHYTPSTASGSDISKSASGATAAWSIDVVKGVTLNTDGKGLWRTGIKRLIKRCFSK